MKRAGRGKYLLAAALIAILLAFAVQGTIAFLADESNALPNTFIASEVDTDIVEKVEGNVKKAIQITNKNTEKTIPVYVRVAIVGNWCNADGDVVKPWQMSEGFVPGENWLPQGIYYYYTEELAVGASTTNLLGTMEIPKFSDEAEYAGLHLEMTVIQQAIQSQPKAAAAEAWNVPESIFR